MLAKKPAPSGAPEWVLTYGDMMSLLLCFFILLAAFADFDAGASSSAQMKSAIESMRQALGVKLTGSNTNDPEIEFNALVDSLKRAMRVLETRNQSDTTQQGLKGRNFRLRRIRDGMELVIGGPVLFEPFSVNLTEEGKESLSQLAEAVKGHRNKLEIRGHAAEQPTPKDWTYDDAMLLSYQRAKHVADELIRKGTDPRAIRIVAVGANEPLPADRPESHEGDNRRVEIIVRESLIDDYVGQLPLTSATRPSDSLPATP
jgi:chemotaxis protein MotB